MLSSRVCSRYLGINIVIASFVTSGNKFLDFQGVCSIHYKRMHVKAREVPYPNTKVQRFVVPDDKVSWETSFPEYKPVDFTSKHILSGPVYADPDISTNPADPPLKFNQLDGVYNVDRTSYSGKYEVVDGLPRNPVGRTGMTGRGHLGRWGPNHAADPIVTRWKHTSEGKRFYKNDKPVLEFVAIKRKDSGIWAIPGGMVDPGDSVSNTLKKEFGEEALNSIEASEEEKKKLSSLVNELFKKGDMIFQGYVDDPRNTDNAWMETLAVNFHDETGDTFDRFKLQAGDDAGAVKWLEVSKEIELYASHSDMVHRVATKHGAFL